MAHAISRSPHKSGVTRKPRQKYPVGARQVQGVRQYDLSLGDRGRLVLPASLRKDLGLRAGERLVLIVEPSGEMRLLSLRRQVDKCLGMFARLAPERVLSEELIAERRAEAKREKAE